MSAVIDHELCTGCAACEASCPGDIIYMDKERQVAVVKYPDECWHCGCCRLECPEDCIRMVFPLSIVP